jgi:hypothetical protein
MVVSRAHGRRIEPREPGKYQDKGEESVMGTPQVPEQVRRAPILALRAVFAGIGRILLSADQAGSHSAGAAPEPVAAAPAAVDPAIAVPGIGDLGFGEQAVSMPALPLANYDSLSLASIRARLRGLDAGQLKVLVDYEAANAERPEVLGMFERRIEKLEPGR